MVYVVYMVYIGCMWWCMGLQWIYDGSTLGLQWVYMVLQYVFNGSMLALQWFYIGATLGLQ